MIKYIDSDGIEYNLLNAKFKLKTGNFHNVSWKYTSLAKQFGVKIEKFEKDPLTLELEFLITGSNSDVRKTLNDIHGSMEKDKLKISPGKLIWGDYYVTGYFIESNTFPNEDGPGVINETVFLAPYPFWISEQKISIGSITSGDEGGKKYPYTYAYEYSKLSTKVNVNIDHYTDSDFKMTVYGPTTSVLINIAGHPYKVDYPLEKGEYMIIDSRPYIDKDKKLYVVKRGVTTNIFQYRDVEHSVFKKIPAGNINIDYSRTHGIDLTIFQERSEPLWN